MNDELTHARLRRMTRQMLDALEVTPPVAAGPLPALSRRVARPVAVRAASVAFALLLVAPLAILVTHRPGPRPSRSDVIGSLPGSSSPQVLPSISGPSPSLSTPGIPPSPPAPTFPAIRPTQLAPTAVSSPTHSGTAGSHNERMERTSYQQASSTVCSGQVSGGGGGTTYDSFCYSTTVVSSTGSYLFREDICRDSTHPNGTQLSFATDLEVDFRILDGSGAEVWRWSQGQSFPAHAHVLQLAAGQCYRWETTWRGNRDGGGQASPGTYTLEMTPQASETHRTQQDSFTVGG
jgi:hypothetical protein